MRLIWFCAAGYSFLCGVSLITFAMLLSIILKNLWQRLLIYAATLIGIFLIFMSATPLNLWFYAIWAISISAWLLFFSINKFSGKLYMKLLIAIGVAITITASVIEVHSLLMPALPQTQYAKLYIIGDSISAGIGSKNEKTWPKLLSEKYLINVTDLSVPGSKVNSAIRQANQMTDDNAMVLLEIGGNDFFGHTSYPKFEQDLRQIFEITKKHKATVIMLELPMLPWHLKYGQIQRKLAKQYDAIMIPKRFLVGVFSTDRAVLDLAHLSVSGHRLMAEKVNAIIGSNLIPIKNGMPK